MSSITNWNSWFAGFCDGEACFSVVRNGGVQASEYPGYTPGFSLMLREDDLPILQEIQSKLGVGNITLCSNKRRRDLGLNNGRDCYQYRVYSRKCKILVDILDGRLQSKKQNDFELWKQAVALRCKMSKCLGDDARKMHELYEQLRATKKGLALV